MVSRPLYFIKKASLFLIIIPNKKSPTTTDCKGLDKEKEVTRFSRRTHHHEGAVVAILCILGLRRKRKQK